MTDKLTTIVVPNPVIAVATQDVVNEYAAARQRFAPLHSPHEGYAVILEELDELWTEVQANKGDRMAYRLAMYKEAKQVAAMALAFMAEVAS